MIPKEFIDRMSHDPKLDAFNAKFGDRLRAEYLRVVLREAEKQVNIDIHARVKEREVDTVVGERAINLENDFEVPIEIRWKEEGDDPKTEGVPVKIINKEKMF